MEEGGGGAEEEEEEEEEEEPKDKFSGLELCHWINSNPHTV